MPEQEKGFTPLMQALESLFLEHRELMDSYGISLGVLRGLTKGPIYEHHKRNVEYIERLALEGRKENGN